MRSSRIGERYASCAVCSMREYRRCVTDRDPDREREAFIQALIARGEAAKLVDGELPPGATHEIVEDENGNITVVRRRFSAG